MRDGDGFNTNATPAELVDRIRALRAEARTAEEKLVEIQARCKHEWGPVVYAPEVVEGYYGVDFQSADEVRYYYPRREVPTWTRRCTCCCKTEETTRVEEVVTRIPKFGREP